MNGVVYKFLLTGVKFMPTRIYMDHLLKTKKKSKIKKKGKTKKAKKQEIEDISTEMN